MARILIADDALFMRTVIKKALTEAGHEVVGEAGNGQVAISLYGTMQPDLVLLDITMPEVDGLTALSEILANHPEARVIMCTALGQQDKVRQALGQGARDYIVKPFTPPKLVDAVSRALA